jgi:hypothetical protein
MREAFGLPADVDYVRTLMASSSDAGTMAWGFPMTAPEMQSLDLADRTAFQVDSEAVIDYASSLPESGGAYFDQLEGGQLVLQFTAVTNAVMARISQLAATDGPATQVQIVRYSFAALQAAMSATQSVIQAEAPSLELESVGIREPENGLVAKVLGSTLSLSQVEYAVAARLGVPIRIEVASGPLVPGSCSTRDGLCQPERGGVWAGTTSEGCTLGFVVTNGSDKQFVTAGHCGSASAWYQPYPYVHLLGSLQSQLYPGTHLDMERVQLPDSDASRYIFGEGSTLIYGKRIPSTGALVYGSLGHSNAVRSGTVYTAYGNYYVNGYQLEGANVHNLVTQGGDSGSPLYYRENVVPSGYQLYATATYSAGQSGGGGADRWWARVNDALLHWSGWDIYH